MPKLELYYAPSSCCDVTLIALEHVGAPFAVHLMRFAKGDHRAPDYMKHNPKGKVPLLLTDGQPLTENVAILTYLARTFPESKLLPFGKSVYDDAKITADLSWAASGLHPLVTRIFVPGTICDIEGAPARVREIASAAQAQNIAIIEERLAAAPWYYGEWSAMDGYIFWVHNRLALAGFDLAPFPRFRDHAKRMADVPAVARAWEKRTAFDDQLKSEGLFFRPPTL